MWYIYTIGYYSATKKWKFAICDNMYGPWGYMWNEISQRKTNTVWSHLYVESRKLINKQKQNKWTNQTKQK